MVSIIDQHIGRWNKDGEQCSYARPNHLGLLLHIIMITITFGFLLLCCCPHLNYFARAEDIDASSGIRIGALVSYETMIGRAAKKAIQMAIDEINKDKDLLKGSKLMLHMVDTNCSAFQGAAGAMELLKQQVIGVIGPQSTSVSHFVAHMGAATQVPLLSFACTDPALSEFQYPYFFRIAHSDAVQMQAIASLIGSYGWREVVCLYTDDDFGSNGAAALSDALEPVGSRLVQKIALVPGIDKTTIGSILAGLAAMQTRVFVVHMPQNLSLLLFSEAEFLGMMSSGYVWIMSDSTAGTLGSSEVDTGVFNTLQGVIGIRGYYAQDSLQLQAFLSKWNNQSLLEESTLQFPIYGLYAYDATWMLARAIDSYLKDGFNFSFKDPDLLPVDAGGGSELAQMKVFEGGALLRSSILRTQFSGASGYIQVNSKGDLMRTAFEIVNVVGGKLHVVGYWTNETQLSTFPPGNVSEIIVDSLDTGKPQTSLQILWPGNTSEIPRGWVLPKNGRPLKIGVPKKAGFNQFISWSSTNSSNNTVFRGFCIDIFMDALKYLPYSIPYNFVLYGNDSTPVYDDMIEQLAEEAFDAVVGDVTITTKRMEKVDFTQPYTESGLVVIVPIKDSHSRYAWAFLRPFTTAMWFTTLAFFIFTGMVVWLLEHKKNRDFRGHPRKQIITLLWFTFSTLFFSQRERTKSTFGRLVILIWLFVVLIITSSYTANLTSILTVQQLTPSIQGISSLQASSVPIGYQTGSFVKEYLISLNIAPERLKPLPSIEAYANALRTGLNMGGVAAIVDELPYVQVFLGTECGFTIAGQEFTKGGWGFAFPKDSELAIDMSTAILTLSENGQLQKIHDLWLLTSNCPSNSNQADSSQLSLSSFWGLFLITGLASILSLIIYMIRLLLQFIQRHNEIPVSTRSFHSRSKRFIKSFASYVDESGKATDKKRGSRGSGKKKKSTPYPPEQSPSSDQSSQSDESSLPHQSPDHMDSVDAQSKHSCP